MRSSLSGGRRQRILSVQALYRQLKTLVSGKGIANLDLVNELIIGDVIRGIDATRITVEHYLKPVNKGDRVLTIPAGRMMKPECSRGGAASAPSYLP